MRMVVVSHDCDIAKEPGHDPKIELMFGTLVVAKNGNFSNAKSLRQLQLDYCFDQTVTCIELKANRRTEVEKALLETIAPDSSAIMAPSQKNILQAWLSLRYKRAAFPNAFENRLKSTGIYDELIKILKPTTGNIRGIYLDLDEGEEVERTNPDDVYRVGIYLLYNTAQDLEKASRVAEKAAEQISHAFRRLLFKETKWSAIELIECLPISDESMSVRQASELKLFNLDHLSLKADPIKPVGHGFV